MKKQFDLKYYLAHPNTKVVTRGGDNVRIICTDRKSPLCGRTIVALIANKYNSESVFTYDNKGNPNTSLADFDLFFDLSDPVKKIVPLKPADLLERVKAGKTMWICVGNDPVEMFQITSFDDEGGVSLDQFGRELEDLLIFNYHFADGDPCWKEVEE